MLKRLGAFFLDILEVITFAIGIFFFIYLLVMRPHKIKGASMHPNYPDGEYLLTEKVSYYLHEPQRGDVVVFKPPISEDEYIKRIIGLPGETISIQNGKIYVNGKVLHEDYLNSYFYTAGGVYLGENTTRTTAKGEYFVVGDNRPHSYDSRSWGPINKKAITGRAWVVYWPPQNAGKIKNPVY